MSKWAAIPIIIVLALGVGAGAYFCVLQTDKLAEAEAEIVGLEGDLDAEVLNAATLETNVATLETDVATLETNVSNLETELTDSGAEVASLTTRLATYTLLVENLTINLDVLDSIVYMWVISDFEYGGEVLDYAGIQSRLEDWREGMDALVEAVGDEELQELWDDWAELYDSEWGDWEYNYVRSSRLLRDVTERINELIDEDIEALEAKLSE